MERRHVQRRNGERISRRWLHLTMTNESRRKWRHRRSHMWLRAGPYQCVKLGTATTQPLQTRPFLTLVVDEVRRPKPSLRSCLHLNLNLRCRPRQRLGTGLQDPMKLGDGAQTKARILKDRSTAQIKIQRASRSSAREAPSSRNASGVSGVTTKTKT